ncbi:MAG: penicillin-binding protein 1A [Ectothiorhodospiraceae bacterium]|jgi:penicillin-binding protein 1A|nr:penicillin-binding protein 1A [Ectothiorhodospiraceae bacterium]
MALILKTVRWGFTLLFGLLMLSLAFVAGAYLYLAPGLPSVEVLRDVQFQVPLRVYSRDGKLLAEYGEKRRIPLRYDEIPPRMVQAFLAAEDDRFFSHPGVDYQGILRAAANLVLTGEKSQGGSTITMQVARNFFLEPEKTYTRKLREVFLALKIERELSKPEILALYLNKIYLGQRAYGVGAASQIYYGVGVAELDLAQTAMIAGLPKAPSRFNPVADPQRALARRNYVLGRMRDLGYIGDAELQAARQVPNTARVYGLSAELEAAYVGEMVRLEMVERFGEDAYTAGYRVHATVDGVHQQAANRALRAALLAYDERHGYRGPEAHVELPADAGVAALDGVLGRYARVGGLLVPALVTASDEQRAEVYLGEGRKAVLDLAAVAWARPFIDESRRGPAPQNVSQLLKRGDVIRLIARADGQGWLLAQVPDVAGGLVSMDPHSGAVLALAGGFDFYQSHFNRITQAERQPGSAFKPFLFSAALEKGYTPASLINDAPVVFEDRALEGAWRPENYSGRFYGPTRLREALAHSRNLIAIRLLQSLGIGDALRHIGSFGFDLARQPRDLTISLGSGTVTPWELNRAYAVFANGGFLVEPYLIERIEDAAGQVIFQAEPALVCEEPCAAAAAEAGGEVAMAEPGPPSAPRVISAANAYQMVSMMQDVIRIGTGRRAQALGRGDLAGKTGTTNDLRDAWFAGLNGDVVATAWVGFDRHTPLGSNETGGAAALPMWIDYMRVALDGKPERLPAQPPGMITVRIDPATGLLAGSDARDAIFETFTPEQIAAIRDTAPVATLPAGRDGRDTAEQVF